MYLSTYANIRGLENETVIMALKRLDEEIVNEHVAETEENELELDDFIVEMLDEYIGYKEETDPVYKMKDMTSEEEKAKVKKTGIIVIVIALVYYMTLFILNILGILPKLIVLALILPILIGAIIFKVKVSKRS